MYIRDTGRGVYVVYTKFLWIFDELLVSSVFSSGVLIFQLYVDP